MKSASGKAHDEVYVTSIETDRAQQPATWKPGILRVQGLLPVFALTLCLLTLLEYTVRVLPPIDESLASHVSTFGRKLDPLSSLADLLPTDASLNGFASSEMTGTGLDARAAYAEAVPQTSVSQIDAFASQTAESTIGDSSPSSSSPNPTEATPSQNFAGEENAFTITPTFSSTTSTITAGAATSPDFAVEETAFTIDNSSPSSSSPAPSEATPPQNFAGEKTAFTITPDFLSTTPTTSLGATPPQNFAGEETAFTVDNSFPSSSSPAPPQATPPQNFAGEETAFTVAAQDTVLSTQVITVLVTSDPAPTPTRTLTTTITALFDSQNPSYNKKAMPNVPEGTEIVLVVRYPRWAFVVPIIVPVAVFTIYKAIWSSIDAWIVMLEPFRALASRGGSLARDGLFSHYCSSKIVPGFFEGIFRGQWIIALSSFASLIAGLLPSLASEAVRTITTGCPKSEYSNLESNPCAPALKTNVAVVRTLQALLALTALVLLIFMYLFRRGARTGIYSDPSSIAAIASLTHHPGLLQAFKSTSRSVKCSDLQRQFANRVFALRSYEMADGVPRYGFCPDRILPGYAPMQQQGDQQDRDGAVSWKRRGREWLSDALTILIALGVLGVITAYYLDYSDSGFNRFFKSDGFGPRFILTAAGSVLAVQCRRMHIQTSLRSTFAQLARGHAEAGSSILVTRCTTRVVSFYESLHIGHYLTAASALMAILTEVLVVALTGVPFTSGEVWMQFLISTYVSMAILGAVVVFAVATAIWRACRVPPLPLEPDTVGNLIWYIATSGSLLRDCEGLEFASDKVRYTRLQGARRHWKYSRSGPNGRWAIDADEDDYGGDEHGEEGYARGYGAGDRMINPL